MTINSTVPAIHAKKRKASNLAFTEQSLKASGPLMAAHIDRWIDLLVNESK
jgi:cytochrome P450